MANVTTDELRTALGGVSFPASKQDLIAHAIAEGADDSVLEALEHLHEGVYGTLMEVTGSPPPEG